MNPKIKELIDQANHIVIFSGAGFSTESDIPDFRSDNGLYKKENKYKYPAEVMLSHSFFTSHLEEFYDYYKNEMIYEDAKPNKGHKAVAKLEEMGKLEGIITQNIDGLHFLAGNKKVFELHGSVHRNYCQRCHKFYGLDEIMKQKGVPYCTCGGVIKPDVVLYEEGLDSSVINGAVRALQRADLLIIAGTSLVVYPAAGLIQYYRGDKMIIINHDSTSADHYADVVSHNNIGDELDFINTDY